MPWLYQQPGSSRWWLGYRVGGQQVLRSTGTADKAAADAVLARVVAVEAARDAGCLTEEVVAGLMGRVVVDMPVVDALSKWLGEVAAGNALGTLRAYRSWAKSFEKAVAGRRLSEVCEEDTGLFLASRMSAAGPKAANASLVKLRVFLGWAVNRGHLRASPAVRLKPFRVPTQPGRRAFSVPELIRLRDVAPPGWWRFAVVAGACTGLRLGDLARLQVGNICLVKGMITVRTRKTGAVARIPMAVPVRRQLEGHSLASAVAIRAYSGMNSTDMAPDSPSPYLWPREAKLSESGTGALSKEFRAMVLVPAGLGQEAGLCFHCLRHSFVSLLKASGATQAAAMALAGHANERVSDLYTHLPEEALEKAIAGLPQL